jgi:hypothetical protein
MELELQTTILALSRLESKEQLGEKAAVNLSTPGGSGAASLIYSRNINDVSVDDVFLEELSSNSPTLKKVLYVTPLKRGPSASSTPSRGSIADEVKEVAGSSMPSPLCDKETFPPPPHTGGLLQLVTRWQESVRRAIIEQAEPAASGRLISTLNKAMEARRDLLARGGEEEEEEEEEEGGELEMLRGEVERLRAQLAVEREERARDAKRLHDVDMVEARLAEMAALLQVLTFTHHFVLLKGLYHEIDLAFSKTYRVSSGLQ